MLEKLGMKYKLSQSARLKHDESSGNYYLFCVKSGNHVRLNRTSYDIIMLIREGKSQDEIAVSLSRQYDVDLEKSQRDIRELFQFLLKNGFINSDV
jgi:hypothetical protein